MSQLVAVPATERTLNRTLTGPLAAWESIFLVTFAAILLLTALWQSSKQFFIGDEFFTSLMASDRSLPHMLGTLAQGGEVNPPLFFVIEWAVARLFGAHEFALRAVSALPVALASSILFLTGRQLAGPRLSALAVALVLGLSRDVFFHMTSARYYGLFLLLVSCAVYQAVRLPTKTRLIARDYLLVFLIHAALAWLHLYGLFFSGAIFVAMVAIGWLQKKFDGRLYVSIFAAWATFGAWIPSLLNQLKVVRGGTWTPRFPVGTFFEDLAFHTPLAFVFLLVTLLGALAMVSVGPAQVGSAAAGRAAPLPCLCAALLAAAVMAVPAATWAASQVSRPFYMSRYAFPSIVAWVLVLALVLVALCQLPKLDFPGIKISPAVWNLAWLGVVVFCLSFQPLRAWKNPPRPSAPFVDNDFGYHDLPMVFEDCNDWMPRAFYGHDRQYFLLIDRQAAEADPGYFTRLMERVFRAWHGRRSGVAYYKDLPNWPQGFLAVDDDLTKTFEWTFAHRPELTTKLLGTWPPIDENDKVFGQKRVFLVQKVNSEKRD